MVVSACYIPEGGGCISRQISSRKATPEEIKRMDELMKKERERRDRLRTIPIKCSHTYPVFRCH